jgi:hypothetical protein
VLAHGAPAHQHRANFLYAFSVFEFAFAAFTRAAKYLKNLF